jgi:hypothetical protein
MFMLCSNPLTELFPMFAMPGLRAFSLVADRDGGGVSCGAQGVFVDGVPLLRREREVDRNGPWAVRPLAELNDELTARYRLPIDVTAKAGALALIAKAFNRDDLALAAIATVQMQFPDPPSLTKGAESVDEIMQRALELHRSHLLKAEWDPTKHPRTGTPPNRAWFAPVPKEPKPLHASPGRKGWPLPKVNKAVRKFVQWALTVVERNEGRILLLGVELNPWIDVFLLAFSPVELNQGEDRLTAQIKAALQPPKSLEELQHEPTENILGYEQHHIVNQNPANLAKNVVVKFGRELINDPSNLAWVPRLKHEPITSYYNSGLIKVGDYNDKVAEFGNLTVREYLNTLDFERQRQEDLRIMRKFGVLK